MKLVKATEEEKRSGWILSPSFLEEIQRLNLHNEDCPTLEGIEMVLLTYEGLNKNTCSGV